MSHTFGSCCSSQLATLMSQKRKADDSAASQNNRTAAQRKKRSDELEAESWKKIDLRKFYLQRPQPIHEKADVVFNIRKGSNKADLLSIFLKFVNHDLVRRIAADLSQEDFQYNKNFMIRFSLQKIYQILSVKIRIYGEQRRPMGVIKKKRPLSSQVRSNHKYFLNNFPKMKPPGVKAIEIGLSRFLLDNRYLDDLSANFMSIIRHLGTYVAGDEKLLKYYGNSPNVRVVWCCRSRIVPLSNNLTYMVDLMLHDVYVLESKTQPVVGVIKRWVDKEVNTLLVFDSYYLLFQCR